MLYIPTILPFLLLKFYKINYTYKNIITKQFNFQTINMSEKNVFFKDILLHLRLLMKSKQTYTAIIYLIFRIWKCFRWLLMSWSTHIKSFNCGNGFFNASMCLSSVSTVPYTYSKTQSQDGFCEGRRVMLWCKSFGSWQENRLLSRMSNHKRNNSRTTLYITINV